MADQTQSLNLIPNTDNSLELGSNSLRWSDVYAVEFHGTATYSGTTLSVNNHELGNLGDVSLSSVSTGDVLVWSGTEWTANSVCNPTQLDNLTNVDAPAPTNGQVLRYNGTTGKWEAESLSPASIGTTFISLSDTPSVLTAGTFLKVNAGGNAVETFADPGYVSNLSSFSTTNLAEGTNLYYTDARFDTRLASKTTDNLTEGTKKYFTNANFDTRLSSKTTADLTEGSNLYYTNARVDSRISAIGVTSSKIANWDTAYSWGNHASAGYISNLSALNTGNLAEGSNQYFTNARADARIAAASIGALIDVDLTGVADNKILKYSASNSRWEVGDDNVPTTIDWSNVSSKPTIPTAVSQLTNDSNFLSTTTFNSSFGAKSTSDLSEGTNLYYTTSRFDTRLATKNTGDLTEGSNLYYTDARADARVNLQTGANLDLSNKSTTDLSEGSNQYFTNARVDARIGATSINALSDVDTVSSAPVTGQVLKWNGSKWAPGTDNPAGNASVSTDADTLDGFNSSYFLDYNNFTNKPTIPTNTSNLTEGSNLYYTDARADTRFDTKLATKSTTNLAEGTNLYYTDTRFDTRLASKNTADLAEGSNLYYTDARVDAHLNQSNPTAGHVLSWNGSDYFWTAQPASETFTSLVQDTSPQLGGALDLNSNNITTSANNFDITTGSGSNMTTVGIGNDSGSGFTLEGVGVSSSTNSGQDIVLLGDLNFTSGGLVTGELIGMWAYDNATSKSAINGLAGATINGTTATIGITYADTPLVIIGNSGLSNQVGLAVGTSADARIHVLDSSSNTIYKFPATDGTANQVLTTNGNGDLSWTAKGSGGASAINNLSDVTINSPSAGQVLKYNGSAWINDTDLTTGGSGTTYDESSFDVKTSNFNAQSGKRYGVNTTSNKITATMPGSPSVGDAVKFVQILDSYGTNSFTINFNGNTNEDGYPATIISGYGLGHNSTGFFWNGASWTHYR